MYTPYQSIMVPNPVEMKSPGNSITACSLPRVAKDPRWVYLKGLPGWRALPSSEVRLDSWEVWEVLFFLSNATAFSVLAMYSPCWFATCAVAGCDVNRLSASAMAFVNSFKESVPVLESSNLSMMSCKCESPFMEEELAAFDAIGSSVLIWGYRNASFLSITSNSALSTPPDLSTSASLNKTVALSTSSRSPPSPPDLTSAQSPMAYMEFAGTVSSSLRTRKRESTLSARRRKFCPTWACKCAVNGCFPKPVLQIQTPELFSVFFLLRLSITTTEFFFTSNTLAPVRTSMPSRANFSAAYFEIRASYVFRIWSADWMIVMLTKSFTEGYSFGTSSFKKSCTSAANSTPVGPPPTTNMESMFLFSSSQTPGSDAVSSKSAIDARTFSASSISFKKTACCRTPGVPKVLHGEPTATTSLS
mmetsp:Transcript_9745/g.36160  ORF Transcript_9745/g.36160 Transcript_9745/m.36160 type:complete len:418 (-) Transcript_9745:551-1804(-)